jgi:hypothetical protein
VGGRSAKARGAAPLAALIGVGMAVALYAAPASAPPAPASVSAPPPDPAPAEVRSAAVTAPSAPVTVLATDDPAALAVAASSALFATAPVAVLAAADDPAGQTAAALVAERIGAPLLLTPAGGDPAGVAAELRRLGADTLLTSSEAVARWAGGAGLPATVGGHDDAPASLQPPAPRPSVRVLTPDHSGLLAAEATARASGARVEPVPEADPRRNTAPASPAPAADERVIALGTGFGPVELLTQRLAVAATGVALPGGGQVLFPGRLLVALYGHPGAPALGVLGEQDAAAAVARARALAAEYQPLVDEPAVPAFELIATVADSAPGPDGNYSAEATVDQLRPWVEAARAADVYVVLDLQPGRADFLSQARRYEELLAEPHVGLALDPEWRLTPDQRHREQVGSVSVDEINAVIGWLAELTRSRLLPQKLVMVHQFRTAMISGRERLDTTRDELAVLIHADGFGAADVKLTTWTVLHQAEPRGVRWGWKNFYDEDRPLFTPPQTMAVGPVPPVFVSYQ